MNGLTLKLIAVVSMLIDHTGLVLFRGTAYYNGMRIVGRLAFPVFCFLLAEGVLHTRNKWRYVIGLVLFACLSEVPFDFATGLGAERMNVFWTLAVGAVLLCICEYPATRNLPWLLQMGLQCILCIPACLLAHIMRTDYSGAGVLLIFGLYMTKIHALELKRRIPPLYQTLPPERILPPVWNAGFILLYYYGKTEMYAAFSSIFLWFYNGKRGPSLGKYGKYAFYIFYPAHLLVLYFLQRIL